MAKPSIPSNSFPDRVKFSFDENDQETCSKYLDWLFARITDYSQSLRRDVTFIILLIAAFELVADSKHVSIGFGSFQLSKGSIVLQFIPVVVSYLLFQTVVNTSRITLLITAFEAALARWAPKAAENDLHGLVVLAPLPLYWNVTFGYDLGANRLINNIAETVTSLAFTLTITLGAIAFEAQAYYVLYHSQLGQNLAWLLSLLASSFCLVMAAIHFFSS